VLSASKHQGERIWANELSGIKKLARHSREFGESRMPRHCEKAKPTWQSRWFKKMHLGLAGLLHFVRNDGKGVVNYGSINK
jgi:hypothetical protein